MLFNKNRLQPLKNELLRTGIAHDLCKPWQKMLTDARDKATLVQMYMRGIDFCFSNDFPTVAYIEKNFRGVCEKYGLYVNERAELHNVREAAFVGRCEAVCRYDGYEVAALYAKDQSALTVVACGRAIVTIDCFGDSRIGIEAAGDAQVNVYRYGNSKVEYRAEPGAKVIISDKNKETYE